MSKWLSWKKSSREMSLDFDRRVHFTSDFSWTVTSKNFGFEPVRGNTVKKNETSPFAKVSLFFRALFVAKWVSKLCKSALE